MHLKLLLWQKVMPLMLPLVLPLCDLYFSFSAEYILDI